MLHEMNPNQSKSDKDVRIDATISDIAHWAGLSYEVTKDEISKFSEKRKIALYDTYLVVGTISEMRRLVDIYNTQSEKQLQITMRYKTQGSAQE